MPFTANDVKNLREVTGVGMMDCKKALTESNGDFDKAVAWLREKGLATAQKKAGRIAAEGIVAVVTTANGAAITEVNIETDFAAKNDIFKKFANDIAQIIVDANPADVTALLELQYPSENKAVKDVLVDRIQVIGENIQIRRFERYEPCVNVSYLHMGGKIGVLVQLSVSDNLKENATVIELGKDLAMQTAAMRPRYLDSSSVSQAAIEEERQIQYNKAIEEANNDEKMKNMPDDKKAKVAESKVKGRMNKFFEEVCLLNQAYVKDSGVTVEKHIQDVAKQLGGEIKVVKFARFEAGEGIEKKQDNFAEEVASMVK